MSVITEKLAIASNIDARVIPQGIYQKLMLARRMRVLKSLLALVVLMVSYRLLAAELTIDGGVVVKFGADAQLVVRDRIMAGTGTILTSWKDDSIIGQLNVVHQFPQSGDWLGLRLEKSAAGFGALTLNDLSIQYAGPSQDNDTDAALTVRGWSPTLQNLLVTDSGVGLRVLDGANPIISRSSFLRNNIGIEADDSAPSIIGSQLVGNTGLAINNKALDTVIQATGNWWGHASGPKEADANPGGLGDAISSGVNFDGFVTEAPLFNPSVRLAEPAPYFDQHTVILDLSCVNAIEYRLVEGDVFTDATFQPLINNREQVAFMTSQGDGRKQISAEFRDTNGSVAAAALEDDILIDTQAPSLTITNPANGSVISQPITIDATASDESGIAKVEFFIDDEQIDDISNGPYSYNWDTNNSADGTHAIRVVAIDIAGRLSEQTVTVNLSRAALPVDTQGPQLTNFSANGDMVVDGIMLARSTSISFSASDPSGIARIELLLDGGVVTIPDGNGSYTAFLGLDHVPNGPHTLAFRATDSLGNVSSLSYAINVAHAPPAAPVLTQPVSGSSSRTETIEVAGTAQPGSDVQLFVDAQPAGPRVAAGGDGRFAAPVTLAAGSNQIQATATDQYGTGPASTVVLVTLDQTIPASPSNLTATAQATGKVRLAWSRSTDPDAVGYDLYRASTSFDSIGDAFKLNSGLLTVAGFDDVPPRDGTWVYRVVAVNAAGTPSAPSNQAQAVSDSTAPRALAIVYTPLGKVDSATGSIGQGQIDVLLTASEVLPSVPFLSVVPQGGVPISVTLTQTGNTIYAGSFNVGAKTPPGLANALFSARDAVGNRGTDIDEGATLKIDTAGPALSGIALDPASPINNDTPQTVEATFTFTEKPKTAPEISALLSGAGRIPVTLTGISQTDDITWSGSFTLPGDAGAGSPETISFSFQAIDDLDNVSTKVLANNRFQVYQGNLPPLDVPFAFAAKAQPGGKVKLDWQAVDQALSYQLYRQAPGQSEMQELTRVSETDYLDQTSEDGTYQYAVASVRKANGEEALSGQSPPVTVDSSATPPGAPENLALRLTGQGIAAEWRAPTLGTVASYNLYRATGTSLSSRDGLMPIKMGIKELTATDSTPSAVEGVYAVTALDAAGNESNLSNSVYLNASLLPVSQVKIDRVGDGLPSVSWAAPNGDIAGYHVYVAPGADMPKILLTPSPITTLTYIDTGYNGGDRLYTIASLDANSLEMPHSLLLPDVTATIAGGLPVRRGVMNQLQVKVVNRSANVLENLRVVVRLPVDKLATQFKNHVSQSVKLDPGQTVLVPVVVGGYSEMPDTAPAQVRVEIVPHEGELVTLTRDQNIEVTEGSLVVGMSTYDFTRGGTGKVKLTIENTSETEVELLTATQNGQVESTELRFKILDADGNVLAAQPYKQGLGANVVSLSNGQTVARVPPHASYVSDEFTLNVPATSLTNVKVKLEVDKLRYHTGKADEVVIEGRGSEKTVSLIDAAYFGETTDVTPVNSFGDQDIVIRGRAIERASNAPLSNTRLKLVLNQQGFERVFSVLTDAAGDYLYTFKPGLTDSGFYRVSTVHPDSSDRPEQKSFTINRVTVGPSPLKLDLPKNLTYSIPLIAKAGPGSTATNLKLTFDAASQPTGQLPAGISLQMPAPVSVASKQSVNVPVVFTAANEAPLTGSLILNVLSDEHGVEPIGQVKIDYALTEAKPFLTSTPSFVETGLAQGGSQIESVVVQNKGFEDAQNLIFKLTATDGSAALSWVSIASQANGTLAVGEQRSIDLSFAPPAGTADGVYQFKLVVTGDNVPQQTLNVFASVTQSGEGNLLFKASDIYTATLDKNGQLIQGLAGATITIQNEDVPTITQELITDSLGEALFENLPAGNYKFRATAANHQEIGGRLVVKPGITVNQPVFLQYNLITVEWNVREIAIEDRYDIVLNATFETDVPAAVVMLEPSIVNFPKMEAGDVFYGELTLTNYGLVRADTVKQTLPKNDAFFRYEFLVDVPPSLEAKQRITIPYRVIALQPLDAQVSSAYATGGGCYRYDNNTRVDFSSQCANGDISIGSTRSHFSSMSNSSCSEQEGSSGYRVNDYYGSFGGVSSTWTPLSGDHYVCRKIPKGNGACQ